MNDAFISAAIVTPLMLLGAAAFIFVVTGLSDRKARRADDSGRPC